MAALFYEVIFLFLSNFNGSNPYSFMFAIIIRLINLLDIAFILNAYSISIVIMEKIYQNKEMIKLYHSKYNFYLKSVK